MFLSRLSEFSVSLGFYGSQSKTYMNARRSYNTQIKYFNILNKSINYFSEWNAHEMCENSQQRSTTKKQSFCYLFYR